MRRALSASLLNASRRFRVQVKHAVAIGPGKADVLQAIAETGSIAEAGRRLDMGYQRVWSPVREMNGDFIEPLKLTQRGGAAGCGAGLTESGTRALSAYRAIERDAERAVAKRLLQLLAQTLPVAGVDS